MPGSGSQSGRRVGDNVSLQISIQGSDHRHRAAQQSSLTALLAIALTSTRDGRDPEPPKAYFAQDLFGQQTKADERQGQARQAHGHRQYQDLSAGQGYKS